MHWNSILAILRKDILDATRDARVLMALIVPIGIAIFYNFIFDDETPAQNATISYTSVDTTELADRLESAIGSTIDLTFNEFDDPAEVRQDLTNDNADIGLIIPAGFDAAVIAGESPGFEVIMPEDPGLDSRYVLAALTPVLWDMAGRAPPAAIDIDTSLSENSDTVSVFEELGPKTYVILSAVLMFVAFVAMIAMPVTLTEEVEKKTIEAMMLIVSYADVIVAKALLGVIYIAIGVPILLLITDQIPEKPVEFFASAGLIGIVLIGFGLFIGVLFKNANQLNTWAGAYLLPIVAPAFMSGLPLPDEIDPILFIHPVSQAMRLMVNGMNGEQLFSSPGLSWLVIGFWGVVGYGLLAWRLSRQNA